MTLFRHDIATERRSGYERRSGWDRRHASLRVTGPYGLRIVLVGSAAITWGLVGLIAGLLVCLWSHG